jgi:hypothetical protein
MPFTSAALAMSTRSLRPRMVAWGAGESSRTAASAASTAGCLDAPIAQPIQFMKVRCASRSTAGIPALRWDAVERNPPGCA